MLSRNGLYYPYIHVRDDEWLKTSALYWKKMSRIVPRHYARHDSRTAAVFTDHGYLDSVDPTSASHKVSKEFGELVSSNSDLLRDEFSINRIQHHDSGPWYDSWYSEKSQQPVGFIYRAKMSGDLIDLLIAEGLSVYAHPRGRDWIPLHWTLANAYMTAVAQQISSRRHDALVTDSSNAFNAVEQTSLASIIAELSDEPFPVGAEMRSPAEHQMRIARVAIETVVPRGLADIDPIKIIEFREKHADLLMEFQDQVERVAQRLDTWAVDCDEDALRDEIRDETAHHITKSVDDLERALKLWGIDSTRELLTTQTGTFAAGLASGVAELAASQHVDILASHPASIVMGAVGFGVTFFSARSKQKREHTSGQPAANYLLQVKKNFAI